MQKSRKSFTILLRPFYSLITAFQKKVDINEY